MEHPGITQRPPAFAELLVDSLDRYTTGLPAAAINITTSSDWRTNFQQIVLNGYFTRLAVSQIQFFWNLPTIITNYNDRLTFAITGVGVAVQIVIPQGYYTPDSLAAQLQALLQAAAPAANFTVTFTQLNGAFSIVSGAGTTFVLLPAGISANRDTRCRITLGFLKTGGAPATSYLGAPPTMLPTRFVDICSSYLTKFQRVKDSTTLITPTVSNVIARVYPTAPNTRVPTLADAPVTDSTSIGSHPFVLCIDYNTPKHIKWSPDEALGNFDIQVRDEFGELLPFSAVGNPYEPPPANPTYTYGCEYQLTILASES